MELNCRLALVEEVLAAGTVASEATMKTESLQTPAAEVLVPEYQVKRVNVSVLSPLSAPIDSALGRQYHL